MLPIYLIFINNFTKLSITQKMSRPSCFKVFITSVTMTFASMPRLPCQGFHHIGYRDAIYENDYWPWDISLQQAKNLEYYSRDIILEKVNQDANVCQWSIIPKVERVFYVGLFQRLNVSKWHFSFKQKKKGSKF